jgi:hypothetical protein
VIEDLRIESIRGPVPANNSALRALREEQARNNPENTSAMSN